MNKKADAPPVEIRFWASPQLAARVLERGLWLALLAEAAHFAAERGLYSYPPSDLKH